MKKNSIIISILVLPLIVLLVTACSTTSALPDGEQLYTGLKGTKYQNYDDNDHFDTTKEEMDVVLATEPNGALFGSSSIRSPFPVGLWIWNAFSKDTTAFSRWMTRSFAKQPVLISTVNPLLHATVGENTLRKRGYFNGKITYETFPSDDFKKAKLQYTVDLGHLWTIDSMAYTNFPADADTLLRENMATAFVMKGDPFDVSRLENERQRVTDLFRDNGYYFYEKNNASFLADTVSVPGKVQMRLQLANGLNDSVMRKWYIGNITVNYKKSFMEKLTKSQKMRSYTINYNGDKVPLRTRALLNDLQIRPRQLYSHQRIESSQQKMNATGLYSMINFKLNPRHDSVFTTWVGDSLMKHVHRSDTLDVTIDCVFDKPYDFYIEAYGKGKTSGKFGPEAIIGFAKRNALRGGELLTVSLHGSYEWQTGHHGEGSASKINSYEYGAEASLKFPRIVNPFQVPLRKRIERMRKRGETFQTMSGRRRLFRRFYDTPTTTLKASTSIINRAEYFKRHIVSGELTYNWQTSAQSAFEFSPITLTYEYMTNATLQFAELVFKHPYLAASMSDKFIPKMSFSYSYHSPDNYRNPITWWTTVSESANLISLGYMIGGRKWTEEDKEMFKNPYAQFLKIETNFTKTWSIGEKSELAAHFGGGVIWAYGNSTYAPYTELFYVGGANSIRAFNVRAIGPGRYMSEDRSWSYVEQTGDMKLEANLEYRPHLFGSLYGAVFLDAGNVWTLHDEYVGELSDFKLKNFFRDLAIGTGIGLRYDLGYFILRLDWGIGLHVPYDTGRSGFYNVNKFADAQAFHLAVGLPF